MHRLRRLALSHRHFVALALCMALFAKLIIPAGYMPSATGKILTVAMCSGTGPVTLAIPLSGEATGHDKNGGSPGANDHPCAFSALGGQGLAATDAVMLAAALLFAFVFALLGAGLPALRGQHHLRPPLRGPPALL